MRSLAFLTCLACGVATLVAALGTGACLKPYGAGADLDAGAPDDAAVVDGGTPGKAGSGLNTGLPCDVQAVLENRCIGCHAAGSPTSPPLLDYADLVAPSRIDPEKTRAEVSLELMKSNTMPMPMPPPPALPAEPDEIGAFDVWVKAGMPKTPLGCTDQPVGDPPERDGGMQPPDGGAANCTSGTFWKLGNAKSELMRPGTACNACHQMLGGPNLRIAGTVYAGLHDPDDCNGVKAPPSITVEVTGKNGVVTSLKVNEAGNFSTPLLVQPPFKLTVTDGKTTRAMIGSVTSGDCNTCHTAKGQYGAPGRILAPATTM